jgi:predicted Zn-dependent protease
MRERLTKIADFMQKHIKADDYELWVSYNESQDTRFAQNSITQHISGDSLGVHYKCVRDKRVGSASTQQVDDENLLTIIKKAEEIAENNSPDPDYAPSMSKEDLPKSNCYFPSIEKLDTAKIIETIKKCIDFAETKQGQLSGIMSKGTGHTLYLTKNGFTGYNHGSSVELSMTLRKDHIETKVAHSHRDFAKINVDNLLAQLNEQFEALKERRDMDFETIPVILRPQALSELLGMFVWYAFGRQSTDEGMTPFTGLLNQKCLGEKFNFSSRIDDPDLPTSPFSGNNVHKNIQWVKDGTLLNLSTSRHWANKHNLTPCTAFNVIIDGEGLSEQEMMKKVKRGLIINNLWYIRANDQKTADMTGMTRDGVLYFEDGEVKYAVNNFRFNEQLIDMTKKILATGKSVQIDISTKVPAILIDGFNFVDKTTF